MRNRNHTATIHAHEAVRMRERDVQAFGVAFMPEDASNMAGGVGCQFGHATPNRAACWQVVFCHRWIMSAQYSGESSIP